MVDIPASCYARYLNPPDEVESEAEVNVLLHVNFRLTLPSMGNRLEAAEVSSHILTHIRDEVQGDLEWALNRQHTTGGVAITDLELVEVCDFEQRG